MQENDTIQCYIVREDPRDIRLLSALHMKDDAFRFMVGIFLFFAFSEWVPNVVGVIFPRSYFDLVAADLDKKMVEQLPRLPFSVVVYALLFGGVLMLGRSLYLLKFLRNKETDFASILDGVRFFFKATLLHIVQSLIISMWTMLLIFPGVMAYYSYRQSFYLLAEDPRKGIFACMAESKIRMRGNRMSLFSLDIGYLFLILISLIPAVILQWARLVEFDTVMGIFAYACFRIPFYYAMGCLFLGQTVFYELLIARGFGNFRYKGETVFRNAGRVH